MSDNGAGSGGTGTQSGSTEGATGSQSQGDNGSTGTEDDDFDKDRALNTIRAQRDSEKALKAQLAAAQQQLKDKDDATLSEQQKLQKRIDEMETAVKEQSAKAQRATLRSGLTVEATELGFRNPALAHKLIDQDDVTYDDAGTPTNLKRLLRDVLKDNPYLAGSGGGADAGAGRDRGGKGGSTDMNSMIRQMTGRE